MFSKCSNVQLIKENFKIHLKSIFSLKVLKNDVKHWFIVKINIMCIHFS